MFETMGEAWFDVLWLKLSVRGETMYEVEQDQKFETKSDKVSK